jgi:hypothetical protein
LLVKSSLMGIGYRELYDDKSSELRGTQPSDVCDVALDVHEQPTVARFGRRLSDTPLMALALRADAANDAQTEG